MSRARSRMRGDKGFRKILRQLPASAKENMADTLADIGGDLLLVMKRDAAKRTGALSKGLESKLLRASLRLRVGLVGKARNRDLYYGRFIEFGRKGQTVLVKNRKNTKPYKLRVREMAPRAYVYKKRTALRTELRSEIKHFWDATLADASAGISIDD